MEKLQNNRGYTLVEMMVVIVLSVLLIGILISILFAMNYQYRHMQSEAEVFSEVQLVEIQITKELKKYNDQAMVISLDNKAITYNTNKTYAFDAIAKKLSKTYDQDLMADVIFDYINDISFSKVGDSNHLLLIQISYGTDKIQKIYFNVAGGFGV